MRVGYIYGMVLGAVIVSQSVLFGDRLLVECFRELPECDDVGVFHPCIAMSKPVGFTLVLGPKNNVRPIRYPRHTRLHQ
jgi:hypothetical protein